MDATFLESYNSTRILTYESHMIRGAGRAHSSCASAFSFRGCNTVFRLSLSMSFSICVK
jgi:hypothetical protein